jgi:hypothetical protein
MRPSGLGSGVMMVVVMMVVTPRGKGRSRDQQHQAKQNRLSHSNDVATIRNRRQVEI